MPVPISQSASVYGPDGECPMSQCGNNQYHIIALYLYPGSQPTITLIFESRSYQDAMSEIMVQA